MPLKSVSHFSFRRFIAYGLVSCVALNAPLAFAAAPPEKVRSLLAEIKSNREGNRSKISGQHEKVGKALTAKNFDSRTYIAETRKLRSMIGEVESKNAEIVAKHASKMTHEERKNFLNGLRSKYDRKPPTQ